jgi:hypothetical protein
MDNSLMSLVGGFIAVAIMLGIGTIILGGATADCTQVDGYTGDSPHPTQSAAGDANATGWAAQCVSNNAQAQSGYALLIITLIVLAAVVVLTVVRMLG